MNRGELSRRRERLQRKLATSFEGWRSGRVDRLKESLRAIEPESGTERSATAPEGRSPSQPWV
ncbi:MAG: hypothetical protein ABI702_05080 [Burkholderiales bacterium]